MIRSLIGVPIEDGRYFGRVYPRNTVLFFLSYGIEGWVSVDAQPRIVVIEFLLSYVVSPHCIVILAALLATKRHVIHVQCAICMHLWRWRLLRMCALSAEQSFITFLLFRASVGAQGILLLCGSC
jgi:hypothetical protein